MKTIRTNLSKDSHFVLTNDDDKIIAIINVPQDEQNITEKILQAIKDDSIPVYAVMVNDLYIDPTATCQIISFEVKMQEEEEGEIYFPTYYLTITEMY